MIKVLQILAETIIYSIKDFGYNFKRVYTNFCRAVVYFRFGWNNPDWDYHYFLKLIQFKLKRMYETLEGGHDYCNNRNCFKSLRIAVKIIDLLLDNTEDFTKMEWYAKKHRLKWGERKYEHIPLGNGLYQYKTTLVTAPTPELQLLELQEQSVAYRLDDERKKRYYKLLFSIMTKHLESWWD